MFNTWDERYSSPEYVYGTEPNEFFRSELIKLPPGRLFLPAEGEGRNAVFAAGRGWAVTAVDFSREGMKKAKRLAEQSGVSIDYTVSDLHDYDIPTEAFDAVGLIYCHIPAALRTTFHQKIINSLKPGGTVILEAFNKRQLTRTSGGPKSDDLLYDMNGLKNDFASLEFEKLIELTVGLEEGEGHSGAAEIIRLLARKSISYQNISIFAVCL